MVFEFWRSTLAENFIGQVGEEINDDRYWMKQPDVEDHFLYEFGPEHDG